MREFVTFDARRRFLRYAHSADQRPAVIASLITSRRSRAAASQLTHAPRLTSPDLVKPRRMASILEYFSVTRNCHRLRTAREPRKLIDGDAPSRDTYIIRIASRPIVIISFRINPFSVGCILVFIFMPNTHRRRDSTVELSRVAGVY